MAGPQGVDPDRLEEGKKVNWGQNTTLVLEQPTWGCPQGNALCLCATTHSWLRGGGALFADTRRKPRG
eukprot:CAMPEP_0180393298 /NCGR_PEP_ID=MMETSP0989-20121125/33671_1 /TAXON_ID=697907 /ORGANISM="non described non described, Strain CCMP2293" /LENGTH=67 /DNA_ID=CAMNT_0022395165 /DNA_START=132 /DNA_END=335 /DNA_ORIENTATION=+